MRFFLSTSIATAIVLGSSLCSVQADNDSRHHSYDRIIAFADSYTDNGNDYRHSKYPPSPPYWHGRFSNGPTWLEHIADQLQGKVKVINHAHGGATTDNAYAYSEFNDYVVPGLKQQIEQFGGSDGVEGNATMTPDRDLYIIYIGYNDMNAIMNPDSYHVVQQYTEDDVANNVIKGIETLIKKYHATTFMVMTCPPFDQWPVIQPKDKPRAKQLIEDYNRKLTNKIDTMKKMNDSKVSISVLDDHAWFEDALAHPDRLGLSTKNGACVPGINQSTKPCDDPEKHFFWDSYHPEAKVHKALGEWAMAKLKEKYHFD